ncbi:MAG: hypothetical protein NC417_01730 [Candidatus Gastranaerophilales bacterium]|nr:hypothetical protein [Candidatus Gastranaerophilales bacterium]
MRTIFVSSTFEDMRYERDAIRNITAPSLNEEARKYSDALDFCDLRWGINTGNLDTEEGFGKTPDVRLNEIEIDRSQPPLVVLLGYRCGRIPDDGSLITTAADWKHLELEDLERSVTALEIEYGVLCGERKLQNTLFYLREIAGDAPYDSLTWDREYEEKVSALKNRIKSITRGRVKEYTLTWNGSGFDGVDAFAKMLTKDIKSMLLPRWRETENLTAFQREREIHAAYIREKNAMFRARQAEAEKLIQDALSQPVTVIRGETGSGKSTIFSHMATELEKFGWVILPFISRLTAGSNSERDIIENIVYFIEEELHLTHYIDETDAQSGEKNTHTPDEWGQKLAELCSAYTKTGARLLVMIDAADRLAPSGEWGMLHLIPESEEIHLVITRTVDPDAPAHEGHYTLRQLDNGDKLDVLGGILAGNGGEIAESVINEILKLKTSHNPLYLSLLVRRLLMVNREDFEDIRSKGGHAAAIEQYHLALIRNKCPDNLAEMSAALLSEAGKQINEKLVSKAAQYLTVSRKGLRRKDLAALLGEEWSDIDFSHFVNYMHDCFLFRADGRYDFTHKCIRTGFRGQCEDWDRMNREILACFHSLKTDDPVRTREIAYHAIAADDKKLFIDHIINHCYHSYRRSHTVREVSAQCLADNGQWIIDVLEEAKKYDSDEKLCRLADFCNDELNNALWTLEDRKKQEIKLRILTANMEFSEHLYHKLKSCKGKRTLSRSYETAAELYEELGGSDHLRHALTLYGKGLTIYEQLAEELDSSDKEKLSFRYDQVARIYEALGENDHLRHALELYEKAIAIREQLTENTLYATKQKMELVSNYNKAARIYATLGGNDSLRHILKLYEKAVMVGEQLAKEIGTAKSKGELSCSYHKVAGIYAVLGKNGNLRRALELYEKDLTLREQLAKEFDTAENKRELSLSYHRVAGIYEKLGGSDNLQLALSLYEKSMPIREQLAAELGTPQSKKDLTISYHKVTEIRTALDSLLQSPQ